jgi:hypothetical protein
MDQVNAGMLLEFELLHVCMQVPCICVQPWSSAGLGIPAMLPKLYEVGDDYPQAKVFPLGPG